MQPPERSSDSRQSGDSVGHALQPASELDLLLPVELALGDGLSLVPRLLALGETDLDLGPALHEVERQGDDRVALLADLALDLLDLRLVQQQLALALRGVVGPGALGVLG